jgi:transposase
MDRLYPTCCGLDVHKRTVVACLLRSAADGQRTKEVRTFETTTAALLALGDWLQAAACSHVALEGTGVYWRPVYNLLEGRCTVILANARHIKAVPGRKTDVSDAEWIADLLQHGLIRPSFVPPRAQRELRDLTRTRTTLVNERSAAVKRLQAVLEAANLKVAGVATDIMGVSGRAMLAALLAGETDPATLAELAKGRLRNKRAALEQALVGRLADHHRLLLTVHLEHVDFLDEQIDRLSEELEARLRPVAAILDRLDAIPGVGRRTAEVLAAEVGLDLTPFPSAAHLASWAGMCPGQYESAGRRKGGTTRKGSPWLRRALVEAACAAARKKDTLLAAQFRRLAVRRGKQKAAVAVGHRLLTIVYALLAHGEVYQERDPRRLDERRRARTRQRALDQLRTLGYAVTLIPTHPEAA